jgi:hypothetical protein
MNRIEKLYQRMGKELSNPPPKPQYTGLAKLGKVIAVKFKQAYVISVAPDGTINICTGGWRTPAVRNKLNKFLQLVNWCVTQDVGNWYLVDEQKKQRYPFADVMSILPSGVVVTGKTTRVKPVESNGRGSHPMDVSRSIHRFVKEYCDSWLKGEVTPPSPGDPWNLYQMATYPGAVEISMAELKLYLKAYIVSKYFIGSLLVVAINDADGEDTDMLSVVDKLTIEKWLSTGTVEKSKFSDETVSNIGMVLKRYLFRVFEKELTKVEKRDE